MSEEIKEVEVDESTNKKVKKKKRILLKLLLVVIALIICVVMYFIINDALIKHNNKKLNKDIEKVASEITYVIIEINPKIILELKDGVVVGSGCLNEDCITIFKDTNIENNSLKEATEKLYNKAKENNIDVSNGVSISSTNENIQSEVKDLDYVKYNKIEKAEEKEQIKNVLDNNDIKEEKKKNEVNNDILSVYKKDKDYGNLYECKIVDSEPVCYITKSFAKRLSYEGETIEEMMAGIKEMRKLENVLNKFNFDYEQGGIEGLKQMIVNRVAVNGTSYPLFLGFSYGTSTVSIDPNAPTQDTYSEYNEFGLTIYDSSWDLEPNELKVIVLPIEKIELISKTYNEKDLVVVTEEDGWLVISNNN